MTYTEIKTEDKKTLHEMLSAMESSHYRLNLLCNRFEQDKDIMLKEGLDLKETITALRDEASALAKMRDDISKILAAEVQDASKTIANSVSNGIKEALSNNISNATSRLEKSVIAAERKIHDICYRDNKRNILTILAVLILPVITVVIVTKLLMPTQIIKYDKKSCAAYAQICRNF